MTWGERSSRFELKDLGNKTRTVTRAGRISAVPRRPRLYAWFMGRVVPFPLRERETPTRLVAKVCGAKKAKNYKSCRHRAYSYLHRIRSVQTPIKKQSCALLTNRNLS